MIELLEKRALFAFSVASFSAGSAQQSIVTADWLHNGRIGVAISNYQSGTVKIGFRVPGGFQFSDLVLPARVDHVATADLNNDRLPDLVISSFDSSKFYVFINNGDRTFRFPDSYAVDGVNSVALGDFDLDGNVDLACAKSFRTGLTTFFGNGTGAFNGPYSISTSDELNAVAIGNVTGGNGRDVVGVDFLNDQVISFRYDGGTSFTRVAARITGSGPADVAIADVVGDSRLDILTANFHADSISVIDASGATMTKSTGPRSQPTGICGADYDGDGDTDVAVVCAASRALVQYTNAPAGLGNPVSVYLSPGSVPRRCVPGKINGDSKMDLFIANERGDAFDVVYYSKPVKPTQPEV